MKDAINNFIKILVKGDFLLVLFIVMIIIIIIFMVYLLKLILSGKYNDKDETDLAFEIEDFVENTKDLPVLKSEEKPMEEEKVIKEEIPKIVQMPIIFDEKSNEEINENTLKNEINNFENEQEEVAIISADELDARIKKMQVSGEMDEHEKEIERYEAEQEDKAVISYDELLKRASTGVVNYESEKDLGGVRVSKVDFDRAKTVTFDNRYTKEEAFLEALKEFRRAL